MWIPPGRQKSGGSSLDVWWPSVNSHLLRLSATIACFSGGKKPSPHPPAPAGIVSLFFFPSCLFPPRRMDHRRPSDTADRPAPETVGPGFHRRPSSVRLGNGRTPCGGRAAGRLPKDQLTSISTGGGEERRCEIKYWIFFGKGAVGALYFWRKATKEAAKASQHGFFSPHFGISRRDFGRFIWKMKCLCCRDKS